MKTIEKNKFSNYDEFEEFVLTNLDRKEELEQDEMNEVKIENEHLEVTEIEEGEISGAGHKLKVSFTSDNKSVTTEKKHLQPDDQKSATGSAYERRSTNLGPGARKLHKSETLRKRHIEIGPKPDEDRSFEYRKQLVKIEIQNQRTRPIIRQLKNFVVLCRLFILLSPSLTTDFGNSTENSWIYSTNFFCSIIVLSKISIVMVKKRTLLF